jgi:hypothetical protein
VQQPASQCCVARDAGRCSECSKCSMGTAALLVALMAVAVTVAGAKGQDGESIATSFLSGQFTSCFVNMPPSSSCSDKRPGSMNCAQFRVFVRAACPEHKRSNFPCD